MDPYLSILIAFATTLGGVKVGMNGIHKILDKQSTQLDKQDNKLEKIDDTVNHIEVRVKVLEDRSNRRRVSDTIDA